MDEPKKFPMSSLYVMFLVMFFTGHKKKRSQKLPVATILGGSMLAHTCSWGLCVKLSWSIYKAYETREGGTGRLPAPI